MNSYLAYTIAWSTITTATGLLFGLYILPAIFSQPSPAQARLDELQRQVDQLVTPIAFNPTDTVILTTPDTLCDAAIDALRAQWPDAVANATTRTIILEHGLTIAGVIKRDTPDTRTFADTP
jgi:hypothetical protein